MCAWTRSKGNERRRRLKARPSGPAAHAPGVPDPTVELHHQRVLVVQHVEVPGAARAGVLPASVGKPVGSFDADEKAMLQQKF